MPEQLSLLGLPTTAQQFRPDAISDPSGKLREYTLFLAIFPQPADALRMVPVAADLSTQHGLSGAPLPAERLHITLHALAAYSKAQSIPQADVDAAKAAAAGVVCPSLPIVFDRALSFAGKDSIAFVLRCDARSDAAVARLRHTLTPALRRVGLRPKPSNRPHMTLLYDPQHVPEQSIAPICWTAARFALILSHVGIGHHQWIDQWTLADRP